MNLELQKRFSIFVSIHVSLVVIKFQTLKDLSPKYPRYFFFSCKKLTRANTWGCSGTRVIRIKVRLLRVNRIKSFETSWAVKNLVIC